MANNNNFQVAVEATPDIATCYAKGLQGLEKSTRAAIEVADTQLIDGSVNIDECTKKMYPQDNRWDYAVGYAGKVYFIEDHSAKDSEVSTMLAKLQWLKNWLKKDEQAKLNTLKAPNKPYIWVAPNGNHISKSSKWDRQVSQAKLTPVKKVVIP